MKKRWIMVVMLMLTAKAIPVMAQTVFRADILRCGAPESAVVCGTNGPATHRLLGGDVRVSNAGTLRIRIVAQPNTAYRIYVGNWTDGGAFQVSFEGRGPNGSIATFRTDALGVYSGTLPQAPEHFFFPPGTVLGHPTFVFNSLRPPERTQFTTGLRVPQRTGE
jgi:hypothetical protein